MSGSPPKNPPYPHHAAHPFVGQGPEPLNPYPNFPPNTYFPPPNISYPITTCDPEDRIPHPPGFIYQPSPTDLVSLSYSPQEMSAPPNEPESIEEPPEPEEVPIEEQNLAKPDKYRWVGASSSSCSLPGALLVGHDSDGSEIYAGRAYHQGDMIPAKVIPSKQVAYIAYGGEEIIKDQFEVIVVDEEESSSCWCCCSCLPCCGLLCPPMVQWVYSNGGIVPEGAVVAGTTADGENLYFGRVHSSGAITPGKVQSSHGCCYYPFDGQEMCSTEYEVLVIH